MKRISADVRECIKTALVKVSSRSGWVREFDRLSDDVIAVYYECIELMRLKRRQSLGETGMYYVARTALGRAGCGFNLSCFLAFNLDAFCQDVVLDDDWAGGSREIEIPANEEDELLAC